ncbi:heavy-metal-associated domain-containing protein [Halonotius roseus]
MSASVTGVTAASADREAAQATVEGDAATDDLLAAVEDAGYEAST